VILQIEHDYLEAELAGLYDFSDCLVWSVRNDGRFLTILRFDFSRILLSDQTAKMKLLASTADGQTFEVDAEAKFFTRVQSLTGFLFFAVALVVVRSDELCHWATTGTKFQILKLRLTDDVDSKVKGMTFNM